MDINKLAPSPWTDKQWFGEETNIEFCRLARSDLDVMMRRKWYVLPWKDGWVISDFMYINAFVNTPLSDFAFQKGHPVGLLTRADEAYRKVGK